MDSDDEEEDQYRQSKKGPDTFKLSKMKSVCESDEELLDWYQSSRLKWKSCGIHVRALECITREEC